MSDMSDLHLFQTLDLPEATAPTSAEVTAEAEDNDLASALAILWRRHRQTNLDRISLLEATAANVLRTAVADDAIADGAKAAHMLAGSLGTFGLDDGSRAALEAEFLLKQTVIDGRLLAEAVTALRESVEGVGDDPGSGAGQTRSDGSVGGAAVMVVSVDAELVARLAVEAGAVGLSITSSAEVPSADSLRFGVITSVIVDEDVFRDADGSALMNSVAELSRKALVFALTDRVSFEDRVELARAGASAVMSRSQGARQILSFLTETLARRRPVRSTVLAYHANAKFVESLREALSDSSCRLEVRHDPSSFWEALEEPGADLVVVGSDGPQLSGSELCRMVRADPRWCRLPVVVVGEPDPALFENAMAAGADDYVGPDISIRDLGVRLDSHLERAGLVRDRCDVDHLTGCENRRAVERSLDHVLRLATRHSAPFALALITIDEFEQIRAAEGTAMGDAVLRRLGALLLGKFGVDDCVGRWTHDGFAVGMYGEDREGGVKRVAEVLASFGAEGIPTTSGKLAHYTFSAGLASSPADGLSLSSLERLGETALRRATAGQNRVVMSGERPADHAPNVVDVVLIEDDDSVADVIEHALRLRHYDFSRFSDGTEAANALGDGQVKGRVVLLDVGLPSLDGFGVLHHLRTQGVLEDTHVIMLTARSSEAEMLRALGLGATEHITKPFSVPLLLARVGQTLSRSVA